MSFQNLWPLFFLILIPVVIFLYFLKQNAKEQQFSSNLLWSEIYKNIEAKKPFEKLKNNILMYLQILIILIFTFAMMAPIIKNAGKAGDNIILLIDNSASMEFMYDDKQTRLDECKNEALSYVDALEDNDTVTLICCSDDTEIIYQGMDKQTIKRRIKDISVKNSAGTLDNSSTFVNSLIAGMENVTVVCYTDTDFDSSALISSNEAAGVVVYSMYSEGENCAVDYVNYSIDENIVKTLCSVTNYGSENVSCDVSLYVDGQIFDVKDVEIEAGKTVNVYFDDLEIESGDMPFLTAELSVSDALTADNNASVQVADTSDKNILLVTDGNVFLEKALALDESYQIYKTSDTDTILQSEYEFDLYVFDAVEITGEFLTELFEASPDSSFMFWNYEEIPLPENALTSSGSLSGTVLSFKENDITEYISDFTFGISSVYTYALPDWGNALIVSSSDESTENGAIAAFYGEYEGKNISIIGFDIHDTDFALQTEFPIFMSQLEESLLESETELAELDNFPTAGESDVTPVTEENVKNTGSRILSGGRNIRNLLLGIVLILLAFEWIVYIRQVHSSKKLQYLIVRAFVMLFIILAMAGITFSVKGKNTETIFVVDVSDSMGSNTEEVITYINDQLADMPNNNKYAVVVFGEDATCWQFMTEDKSLSTLTANVVTSSTNIEKAVQMAANLFDDDAYKRMVLISDGSENEGDMYLSVKTLTGNDIELYAISMDSAFGTTAEVYIDDLEVPSVIHEGDNFNVTVTIESNVETEAVLTLYEGRTVKERQDIQINKGTNKFVFTDTGESGTIASYKAVIEPASDTEYVNNTYVTYAEIDAVPKILLIEGTSGESEEFQKVLDAANIDYDVVSPKGAPTKVSGLTEYKAVITLDVYYDDLKSGFADALDTYIKDYAGGYICIGGENSYALGGYKDTVLEDVLPVYMDLQGEKEIPKLSMTMVIDQSGSMTSPATDGSQVTGLTLAKQAAMAAVDELRTTDDVGVLAFDDTYNWVVALSEASDLDGIKESIETIGYGGGTSIYPALEEAYEKTLKSDAVLKHIILLTDGQDEYKDYEDLIAAINDAGITLSTVAVGSDADTQTLKYLAESCGGRYYYTDVNNSIPRIFAQEVYLSTNTYLINEEFYPVLTSNNRMTEGVFDDGIPALYGYVATTAKETADVILESEAGDPILSTWQYGLGKTVAWCSDGTNEWTAEFALWEDYPYFWSNIINYVITDTSTGEDVIEITDDDNMTNISLETDEYDTDTTVTAVITNDEGESFEVELNAVKPGTFETDVDLSEVGVYSISIRKSSGDEVVSSYNTAVASQYSKEYKFYDSEDSLESLVSQANGEMLTLDDSIWTHTQKNVTVKKSLTMLFLILALILLMLDIIVRRLALNPAAGITSVLTKAGHLISKPFIKRRQKKSAEKQMKTETSEPAEKELDIEEAENTEHKKQEKKSKTRENKKSDTDTTNTLDMETLLKKKHDRE